MDYNIISASALFVPLDRRTLTLSACRMLPCPAQQTSRHSPTKFVEVGPTNESEYYPGFFRSSFDSRSFYPAAPFDGQNYLRIIH